MACKKDQGMRYFWPLFISFLAMCGLIEAQVKQRELLITGCARSGTTFVTKFFRHNGYHVLHEADASFGVVSWLMAVDAETTPFGPGAQNYRFAHVFHQVRHPLKTIASASHEPEASWKYIRQFIPEILPEDPQIVKGAKYWYYWNLLAEQKAEWTYRVENLGNQVDEMASRLGYPLEKNVLERLSTTTNTRNYQTVYTWKDLERELDEHLYYNIIEMTLRYGYDTP